MALSGHCFCKDPKKEGMARFIKIVGDNYTTVMTTCCISPAGNTVLDKSDRTK